MPRRVEEGRDVLPRRRKSGVPLWLWVGLGCGGGLVAVGLLVAVVGIVLYRSKVRPPEPVLRPAEVGDPKIKQMAGLLAYWSFDDVQSGRAVDGSGRNNNAKLVGAGLGPGARGQGLQLDGRPDHYCDLGVGKDLNFAANAPFTFAGWYRTPLPAAVLLSLRNSRGPQQIDLIVRDNKLLVVVGDDHDPETQNAFVWSKRPNDGQWHHFAFTRRGSTIELFQDGVSQGTGMALCSGGPVTTDHRALGCERMWVENNVRRYGNPAFEGGLDEVCVFNRALAPAEIQALMER
jgi:hypothetical protein